MALIKPPFRFLVMSVVNFSPPLTALHFESFTHEVLTMKRLIPPTLAILAVLAVSGAAAPVMADSKAKATTATSIAANKALRARKARAVRKQRELRKQRIARANAHAKKLAAAKAAKAKRAKKYVHKKPVYKTAKKVVHKKPVYKKVVKKTIVKKPVHKIVKKTIVVKTVSPRKSPTSVSLKARNVYTLTGSQIGTNSGHMRYKVRSGDTLSRIAAKTGINLHQLIRLNGLTGNKKNHIKVGQSLALK